VAGGQAREGQASARTFRLSLGTPVAGSISGEASGWQEGLSLRQPCKNLAMAVLGRQILVAGGRYRPGRFLASAELGEPLGGWNHLPPLPQALDGLRGAGLEGRACLVGGFDGEPRRTACQGAWRSPASDWCVDRRLGFHLAWYDPTVHLGPSARPLLTPTWKADITNIAMTGLKGLGFPISDPAPEGRNFYLKFFACPSGIDPVVSARRALSPLLVLQMGGSVVRLP